MQLLLSQPLADEFKFRIKERAARVIDAGTDPQLAVILVGAHPDSLRYIALKTRIAKECGIIFSLYHMEEDVPFEDLMTTVRFLNEDSDIHGIIVQLPLPDNFSEEQVEIVLKAVEPDKDVDGLSGAWKELSWNYKTYEDLVKPHARFVPPMVSSILSLLDHYGISVDAGSATIIGKGRLVGDPLATYLHSAGVDVTSVDEETEDILDKVISADLVISGTGEKDLVTYQWIKPGATVIDCAEDIHQDSVEQVAGALAPSKGGVGPLTVLWLLHNVVLAAENQGGLV